MAVTIVAEIGQNHNGDVALAIEMMARAKECGADLVKFQKREVEQAIPRGEWDSLRETPWGRLRYIDYRRRLEFSLTDFRTIDDASKRLGIPWSTSVWDIPSVDFMVSHFPALPWLKVPSAMLTNVPLLSRLRDTGRPTILSTGMSTLGEVVDAVRLLHPTVLLHCCSAYPCPNDQLNLRCIPRIAQGFPQCIVGYSGHEVGLAPSVAAVALGAQWIERHFTLDRTMWGTDQAASVEPNGLRRLVKDIRIIEKALGDGVKRVQPSEREPLRHLRGVQV